MLRAHLNEIEGNGMRAILGFTAIGLALFASGCVNAPPAREPAPSPAPVVRPAPAPPAPVLDWVDRPATPGDWSYRTESNGSSAIFGEPSGGVRFAIRCDITQRRILFSRPGTLDPGRAARLTLTSTGGSATYALANAGGDGASVVASVAASDPFLDRLVYTRGRFLVRTDGQPDMVLPNWAEISRVLEDCRG